MNDQPAFESHSEENSPEPVGVNRILRFESGTSLGYAEVRHSPIPMTSLETTDVPHRLYQPEGYEASYSYPLLVWLHDDGASEEELDDLFPRISERNYLGVAMRGNVARSEGFGWSTGDNGLTKIIADLEELVTSVGDRFPIHQDRVYLAGFGTGGTLAWEILLRQPKRWTGAICLSGDFPKMDHPLAMFRQLQQRRLLVSTGLDCPPSQVKELVTSGRLMYSAGMEVGTRIYDAGRRAPSDKMLRDVDRWMMDSIATAVR